MTLSWRCFATYVKDQLKNLDQKLLANTPVYPVVVKQKWPYSKMSSIESLIITKWRKVIIA